MARIHLCGYEVDQTLVSGVDKVGQSGTVTRDTSVFRSGLASAKFNSGAGNNVAFDSLPDITLSGVSASLGSSQTTFWRAYMRFDNPPASTARVMDLSNGSGSATGVSVRLTSGGKLQLWNNAAETQIGSDSSTVATDGSAWYRIEVKVITDATPQITDVEFRLDETSVASASGLTITISISSVFVGWCVAPGDNKVMYVDDSAANDSTGSVNNSWPGAGSVVLLKPISDNARVGWTNAAGGTTNLFNDVDNTPPVGVASPSTQPAQIKRNAANTTDTYDANLTSYMTAGLAAADTLNAIQILFNIGYSANFANSQGLRMLSNPVISEFTKSGSIVAVGSYPTQWTWGAKTTEYGTTVSSNVTVGTSPVLRVRKNTSSSSRIQFCDFMGAYVDYTPASGGVVAPELKALQGVNRLAVW